MRRALAIILAIGLPACGGGGSPSTPTTQPPAPRPTATPAPTPVPPAFGPGQYLVNSRIAPGRYFADPPGSGCYWERESGTGGTLGEVIANDFIGYDSRQVIVDILASDVAFKGDADCGSWYTTVRQPAQGNSIPPGTWLVGGQVAAGTYQINAGASCYWERVRDFQGGVRSIIANEFIAAGGPALVTISSSDVGFTTDGDCGTWTRSTTGRVAEMRVPTPEQIEEAWRAHRAKAR